MPPTMTSFSADRQMSIQSYRHAMPTLVAGSIMVTVVIA